MSWFIIVNYVMLARFAMRWRKIGMGWMTRIGFFLVLVVGGGAVGCGPVDDKGSEDESANCESPRELGGSITSTETLSSDGCFEVVDDISVEEGGHLIIEDSTVVRFARDTGLAVHQDGKLTAVGSESGGILLTGIEEERGFWKGILIDSSDTSDNQLEYVTIEYGGGESHFQVDPGNLVLATRDGAVRASIDYTTLRESGDVGFRTDKDEGAFNIDSFENNTLTANAANPATLRPETWGALSGSGSYGDNEEDYVFIEEGDISEDQQVDALDVPYRLSDNANIDEAAIEIAAGTEVRFEEDAGLSIKENASLKAVGTEEEPIVMTGVEQTRGFWRGIAYQSSESSANQLDYVTIEYGGGSPHFQTEPANLLVDTQNGPARLSVDNSTLRESGNVGFRTDNRDGEFHLESFENNTLTSNADGPAYLLSNTWGALSESGDYGGNDEDVVFVEANHIEKDQQIDGLGVPYRFGGSATIGAAAVEFGARATVEFASGGALEVEGDASLKAAGTEEEPVVLTAVDQSPGFWDGIIYRDTESAENVLDNIVIEYAGGETHNQIEERANLVLDSTGDSVRVTLDNATIRDGAGGGLFFETEPGGSSMRLESCGNVNFENVSPEIDVDDEELDPSCPFSFSP